MIDDQHPTASPFHATLARICGVLADSGMSLREQLQIVAHVFTATAVSIMQDAHARGGDVADVRRQVEGAMDKLRVDIDRGMVERRLATTTIQ